MQFKKAFPCLKQRRHTMSKKKNKKNIFQKFAAFHRKLWSARIIPNLVTNGARIFFYRLIGYKNISKKCFIGMKCYLDDLEPKMITIEEGVSVSYGTYFACHGKGQDHNPILIKKGAYIGMHSTIISPVDGGIVIGEKAIVGAGSLVNRTIPDGETWAGNPARKIK